MSGAPDRATTTPGEQQPGAGGGAEATPHRPVSWPGRAAAAVLVGGLALTLRLATWREVFGDGVVRLVVDGDPYYHLRRARTILATGAIPWRDGWLNYPAGADVPWPPLFDLLLAACAWLVGLGDPSPETIVRVAAFVPPVLGLASIAVAAAFAAEVFGPAAGALTGLLLAASPTHVVYSLLGRPDQHVLEILLFTAVALAMARGLGEGRTRPRTVILLGVIIALSFWNWLGSAFTLLVAGVACAVHAVVTSPERAAWGLPAKLLGAGSAIAAALLALSIGAAGRRGALGVLTLGGLSGFQVLVALAAAALAFSTLLARRRSGLGRAAVVLGVPAASLAVLAVLFPGARDPVLRGLTAAGAGSPWYGSIDEFLPALFSGVVPLRIELTALLRHFGLVPALGLAGLAEARARLRLAPERSGAVLLAVVLGVVLAIATFRVRRFAMYGSVPLAVFAALGLLLVRRRVDAWRPGAGPVAAVLAGTLALAPAARALRPRPPPIVDRDTEGMLARIRTSPEQGDRRAVLARWAFGHHILVLAERPVVASPFGTEGGVGAMEDLTAFFTERSPEAAQRLLDRRGVQYVLVSNPFGEPEQLLGHGVTGRPGDGAGHPSTLEEIRERVASRLYDSAGSASDQPARPALEGYRLVDDVGEEPEAARLFEVVPGARVLVRGGTPGARVVARVELTAPFGGTAVWRTHRQLDAHGEARLRLPYATGANGRIRAGPWELGDGIARAALAVTEAQVLHGAALTVDLSR